MRTYTYDPRLPHQCGKGCNEVYPTLLCLAAHEERCTGDGRVVRETIHRCVLNDTTKTESIIIVARSSAEAPIAWKANKEYVTLGYKLRRIYKTARLLVKTIPTDTPVDELC